MAKKSSVNALVSAIKRKCGKGRRTRPLAAFRSLVMKLPEFQSQEASQAALADMDLNSLMASLRPQERAYAEQHSDNAKHTLYFCFLAEVRHILAAWLIRNDLTL